MRILYSVSPIGLGHATRSVAVGEVLTSKGVEVEFLSGGQAAALIGSYGFKVRDVIKGAVPTEREGGMVYPALWYLRYWWAYRRNRELIERVTEGEKWDLVVGDEEFSSISVSEEKGLKHIMITDELELGFAQSRLSGWIERKVKRWYEELQRNARLIIVPEVGEDSGNLRHVPPIVRPVTRTREQVLSSLGLPQTETLITFSMSGSGLGAYLAERTAESFLKAGLVDAQLVLSGVRTVRPEAHNIHPVGFVRENHELIAASDLVVTSAGKSTIDEALSEGTPVIAIPFRNHFEQVRNAQALGFTSDDIDRLDVLIQQHVGRRTQPMKYKGAAEAASIMVED